MVELNNIFGSLTHKAAESPDPSTQNAACIVGPDGRPCALSCNRPITTPYPSMPINAMKREDKLARMSHAEEECVSYAMKHGIATRDCILCALWAPCSGCARDIIRAEVRSVVVYAKLLDQTPHRWFSEVTRGVNLLLEAGIRFVRYEGPLAEPASFRFNGDWVKFREITG